MFIAVFVAYYILGLRQHMGMGTLLTHTENGWRHCEHPADYQRGRRVPTPFSKSSGLADTLAVISKYAYAPDSAGMAGSADSARGGRLRRWR